MDWSNERYVRVYTRDTADWKAMVWQARALFPLLLRACDRSGVIQVKAGPSRERLLAGLVGLPLDVAAPGLADLLADGCIVERAEGFVIRNFIEAQEAPQSDAFRAKESRARHRERALAATVETSREVDESSEIVTKRDAESQNVTERHEGSDVALGNVTPSTPSTPSVPSEHLAPQQPAPAEQPVLQVQDPPPAKSKREPKPRAPSRQERLYAWMRDEREKLFPRAPADESFDATKLNPMLKPLLDGHGEKGAQSAWIAYLRSNAARDAAPPAPLRLFVSIAGKFVTESQRPIGGPRARGDFVPYDAAREYPTELPPEGAK